jgi:hypothetical protein
MLNRLNGLSHRNDSSVLAPYVKIVRLLPAFVDLLAATGGRPNEALALRWSDVDVSADPPTVTIDATLIDHGRIAGWRCTGRTRVRVMLPHTLWCYPALVLMRSWRWRPSRTGQGRCSRIARAAGCRWRTCGARYGPRFPHIWLGSPRTASAARSPRLSGMRSAPSWRSSSYLTRSWQPPKLTICSGILAALMYALRSMNMRAVNVSAESGGKVADSGRVACRAESVSAGDECARRDSNPQPSDP